jgi:hypothetical protein
MSLARSAGAALIRLGSFLRRIWFSAEPGGRSLRSCWTSVKRCSRPLLRGQRQAGCDPRASHEPPGAYRSEPSHSGPLERLRPPPNPKRRAEQRHRDNGRRKAVARLSRAGMRSLCLPARDAARDARLDVTHCREGRFNARSRGSRPRLWSLTRGSADSAFPRWKWRGTGREHPSKTSGKPRLLERGGAESSALGAREPSDDPKLAEVVACWPTLPEAVKASILAAVRAAIREG